METILSFITLAAIVALFYFNKKQYDLYKKQVEDLNERIESLELDHKHLHEIVLDDIMGVSEK
jgi:hypothetical protein